MSGDHVYHQQQKLRIIEWQHLDLFKFYPMALVTSWSVRGLLYPLTVVKSRLQLQKQNHVYRGMRHAFVDMVRSEGVTSLYRGFWITLPQLGASFIYSTIYEKFRNILHVNANIQSAAVVSALAGGCASAFTQIIFVPTDNVSQHMMIHNNPKHFAGESILRTDHLGGGGRLSLGLRVTRMIYYVDGLRGFYRGFLSSMVLYISMSMVFWTAYYNSLFFLRNFRTKLKSEENRKRHGKEHLLLFQAISGAFGGVCAAIITNPLEVVRVRTQVQRTNYLETVQRLYQFEKHRVFNKGLAPRMISNGINSCLIMTGYEVIKRLCVLPEYRDAIVW